MKIILIRHAEKNENIPKMNVSGDNYKLYSSPDELSLMTADAMWDGLEYEVTDRLSELSAEETADKKTAADRARSFLDMIEGDGYDVIAVSHEGFMKVLFKQLRRRGYTVKRTNIFKVDYLEKAVATKRRDHCGQCTQNCLLSNPGCDIGRDLARRSGYDNAG